MKDRIALADLVPVLQEELAKCDHGVVRLELTVHEWSIVRWRVVREIYSRPMITVPHPDDNV